MSVSEKINWKMPCLNIEGIPIAIQFHYLAWKIKNPVITEIVFILLFVIQSSDSGQGEKTYQRTKYSFCNVFATYQIYDTE